MKGVEIAYLVDPDSRLFASRASRSRRRRRHAQVRADLRKALETRTSTPSRSPRRTIGTRCWPFGRARRARTCTWRSRAATTSSRAASSSKRHGSTTASSSTARKAAPTRTGSTQVAAVRSGKYGKLLISYGYASKPRRSIGFSSPKQPPKELDYDLWLGPAPQQPYHENLVHYNWHWFWDFGNGEIGNQGVHQMDIARWAMPEGAAPRERDQPRRPLRLQGPGPDAQHAIDHDRLRRPEALLRGPRPGRRQDDEGDQRVLHGRGRDPRRPVLPQGQDKGRAGRGRGVRRSRQELARHDRRHISATSSTASAAANAKTSTPKSSKGSSRRGFATWQTSPTGWAGKSLSARRPEAFGDDKAAGEAFEGMKEHWRRRPG